MQNAAIQLSETENGLQIHDVPTPVCDQRSELMAGLRAEQKWVSPKYFYDDKGSRLFDQITQLPEYYPTRAEQDILSRHGEEISSYLSHDGALLEPGSGSCNKVPYLLRHALPGSYVPIEISRECLIASSEDLQAQFPKLDIQAICSDFTVLSQLPKAVADFPRKTAFFPGSTIGNFTPEEACQLLKQIRRYIGKDGTLLIGVDLLKPIQVLHRAYNDRSGITARFNLNLLDHIARILNTDFDVAGFEHLARFNASQQRVEMHLRCTRDHSVQIDHENIRFRKGETIHTENSYKYTTDQFEALANQAGFKRLQSWYDSQGYFSFHCFQANTE